MPSVRRLALLLPLLAAACLGDPHAHLERARELTFKRQPAAALQEYEEVLSLLAKKDPAKVRPVLAAALKGAGDLCYLEFKNYSKAAEYYRSLTNKFPQAEESYDARANMAQIFEVLGDRRSAVAELSTLVQSFPKGPEVDRYQYSAAKGYFELGDYDQAILESRMLQSRFPNSEYLADAQMLVGTSLALQGQRDKAIEAFQEVVKRWPQSDMAPRALFEEAKVFADKGQEEKAVALLIESLKAHPDPKGVQSEISRMRKRMAARRVPKDIDRTVIWPELRAGSVPKPE